MGNPDPESAGNRVRRHKEVIVASSEIGKLGENPIQYIYPVLNTLPKLDIQEVFSWVMNEEMKNFWEKNGYEVLSPTSHETALFLRIINDEVNSVLSKLGYKTSVDIGTPVVFESIDSDRVRKVNIISTVIKKGVGNETKYALLLLAVDIDEGNHMRLTEQRRSSGEFSPLHGIIELKSVFGYRGMFANIISYPITEI